MEAFFCAPRRAQIGWFHTSKRGCNYRGGRGVESSKFGVSKFKVQPPASKALRRSGSSRFKSCRVFGQTGSDEVRLTQMACECWMGGCSRPDTRYSMPEVDPGPVNRFATLRPLELWRAGIGSYAWHLSLFARVEAPEKYQSKRWGQKYERQDLKDFLPIFLTHLVD